eukprot:Sspe_Gene.52799::Locus_29236_Transcript_2_2_Confidence_0.600_Length_5737::g.52799::m.52799/K03002/RPA2, POLR1B; DNA-directed RNA polymerase I subunit RPA2
MEDDTVGISPEYYLGGTRAVRKPPAVDELTKKHSIPRNAIPDTTEEMQLRGLRRSAAEQVIRKIRQLDDMTAENDRLRENTQEPWRRHLRKLLLVEPEELWKDERKMVKTILAESLPGQYKGTETEALYHDIKTCLNVVNEMTEALKNPAELRKAGGAVAAFPHLRQDFTDVVAPHVKTFNWAVETGLSNLIQELNTGMDGYSAQAVPMYYVLSLDNVKDFRQVPGEATFKHYDAFLASGMSEVDWKGAQHLVEAVVNAALESPPGLLYCTWTPLESMERKWCWLVTLQRHSRRKAKRRKKEKEKKDDDVLETPNGQEDEEDLSEEEFHESSKARRARQKREQAKRQQGAKSVEEKEAGGARKLLEHLQRALKNVAIPTLQKVYVTGTISRAFVGWEADDGPHTTPCGRAALRQMFLRMTREYLKRSPGHIKPSRRHGLKRWKQWLEQSDPTVDDEQDILHCDDDAVKQERPDWYPDWVACDEETKGKATPLYSSALKKRGEVQAVRYRIFQRWKKYHERNWILKKREDKCMFEEDEEDGEGKKDDDGEHDDEDDGRLLITCHPMYKRGKKKWKQVRNKRYRKRDKITYFIRQPPTELPQEKAADMFGRSDSEIQDPGLPPGGLEALRDLWRHLLHTPDSPLQPQGHRLHGTSYTMPLMVQVKVAYGVYGQGPLFEVREWVYGGAVPVMLRSKPCVLHGVRPGDLAAVYREEQREPGGYFISKGNERVLRMILVARGNHAITLERASFANKGLSFTSKCVFIRCVRSSGLSVPNYLYMLSSGKVILSFSRGSTWQVPLSLVLLSLGTMTPLQLAQSLRTDIPEVNKWSEAFLEDFLNQIQLARYAVGMDHDNLDDAEGTMKGFPSHPGHWQYLLGRYICAHAKSWVREMMAKCRSKLSAGCFDSEVYRSVGLWVIREHVLPHLNGFREEEANGYEERERKMHALVLMVRKLMLFQAGKLREDGEDRLMNQEVITPGQLWLHAVADGLASIARGVRNCIASIGLSDCKPRAGFEDLFPRSLEDMLFLITTGRGTEVLREVVWKYFWIPTGPKDEPSEVRLTAEALAALSGASGLHNLDGVGNKQKKAKKLTSKNDERWRQRYDQTTKPPDDGRKGDRRQVIGNPTYPVTFLVSTGNYTQEAVLANGAALPQASGWSVVVERINIFRFLEQFRATHRGKVIQEMRTTDPRRYQMDGWGFLCIVHTPDGGPCGVLNHLTHPTVVTVGPTPSERQSIRDAVATLLGADKVTDVPWRAFFEPGIKKLGHPDWFPATIDGEVIGMVHSTALLDNGLGDALRVARAQGFLPPEVETATIDPAWVTSQIGLTGVTRDAHDDGGGAPRIAPGLHIFSGPGRLSRPIRFLGVSEGSEEGIVRVGTLEQIFLDIASLHADLGEQRSFTPQFKYIEVTTTTALSLTASLIPFFEMNCSPRNLFQCGMAKQTMGGCFHSLGARNDNKLYHTHFTQAGLLRTENQHAFAMDDYPNGLNVILAVAAYTGYDMEDALLLNRNSVERGMFQGSVYLGMTHSAAKEGQEATEGRKRHRELFFVSLPYEGQMLQKGDVIAEISDGRKERWEKAEPARIHSIEELGCDADGNPVKLRVIYRIQRIPVIGDKFASRHGQKGTLPVLVPQQDMPFSEDGLVPDVIINPHAFPSRMTVGMLLEMIVAKYGALKGTFPDATAWSEVSDRPIHAQKIGDLLSKMGYNREGVQMLTNGATGEQMMCDIYIGICYYQRLRHMVDDKYQARERAERKDHAIDPLTGQPVKGRKRGGGIRVGEMERDALIAHGTTQVGKDRLLRSSDLGVLRVCAACGATPCTCEDGGVEQYRIAPKVVEFLNAQLRTMGASLRTFTRS